MLAGTDNDYSATQNPNGIQFDVRFKPGGSPVRIRCDVGTVANCVGINGDGAPDPTIPLPPQFDDYQLIPGVLHAYKASSDDLSDLVRPGK